MTILRRMGADGHSGTRWNLGFPGSLIEWFLAIGAVASALFLGWFVVSNPEFLNHEVRYSPRAIGALALLVALVLVVLHRAEAAAAVLIALVYLNLSDVLIRSFGLPSLLQLLGLPILISAWTHRTRGFSQRLLGEPLTWVLAAYALFNLASSVWADDPSLADARTEEFLKALVLYGLVVLLLTTPRRVRVATWTMVGCGAFLAILGLAQLAMGAEEAFAGLARARYGQIYGDVFGLRLSGPLGDPNFFAQVLLMLAPLSLFLIWEEPSRRARLWAVVCLLLILSATTMTYSRGGAIALVFTLVAFFMIHGFRRQKLVVTGIPLLLIAALLIPSEFRERLTTIGQFFQDDAVLVDTDSSVEERLVLMGSAWEMLAENPLLGVGAGNYTVRFGEYAERFGSVARDYEDPDAVRYAHNLLLEVGAETGSVGLILFVGSLLVAFGSLGRARERLRGTHEGRFGALAVALQISLAGYLISALFLHGDFERYLWLYLGMAGALHAMGRLGYPSDAGRAK